MIGAPGGRRARGEVGDCNGGDDVLGEGGGPVKGGFVGGEAGGRKHMTSGSRYFQGERGLL